MATAHKFPSTCITKVIDLHDGVCVVQSKIAEDFTATVSSKSYGGFYKKLSADLPDHCEQQPVDQNFRPLVGECVVVYVSHVWERGYVLSVMSRDFYRIAVYDACVVCTVNSRDIRRCPVEFLDIPSFGIRVSLRDSLDSSRTKCVKRGDQFRFSIVDRNGTTALALVKNKHICKGTSWVVTLSPWIPKYEDKGLRCVKLTNKCAAQVVSYSSQHDIYVCPLDEDNVELRNSVIQDVVAYCDEAPVLERLPDPGELVACRFTSDEIYYRALVITSRRECLQVIYVDFGNVEYVTIDRLKPLKQSFKQIPCTAVHISLIGVRQGPLTEAAINFLDCIIMTDAKVRVNFTDSYVNGVFLTSEQNDNINDIISDLLTPKWKKNLEAGLDPLIVDVPITVDENMHFIDLPVNKKINLFILNKNAPNDFHGCAVDDMSIYILKSLPKEMDAYCASVAMDCYTPRVNELCVAMYGEEWLRAVCLRIEQIGCAVYFIDWGNIDIISPKFIRKMPQDFVLFPALANRCKQSQLPENLSDDRLKEIDDLVPLYSICTVEVTSKQKDVYFLNMLSY